MASKEDELAAATEEATRQFQRLGYVLPETQTRLQDAQVGIKNFTLYTNLATRTLQLLGSAISKNVKAVYEGETGAKVFNKSLDDMADAAQGVAVVLSTFLPGGYLMKAAYAGITYLTTSFMKAGVEVAKTANEQSDKLYNAFSQMAKSGAVASAGTTGLAQDIDDLSLNVNQLDKYIALVNENSQQLSDMGGSVAQGRKQFTGLVKDMEGFQVQLLNLGLDFDEQAEAALSYAKLQSRLTMGQQRDYKNLGESAVTYIKEMDALTKVTGLTRKQQEDALEKQMRNQRFAAKVDSLRAQGQTKAADMLVKGLRIAAAAGDDVADAYADSATGMLTSDAAIKGHLSSQGEILRSATDIASGRIQTDEELNKTMQGMMKSIGQGTQDMNMAFQQGVGEGYMLQYGSGVKAMTIANNDFATNMKIANEEVLKQAAGSDKLLKEQSEIRKNINDQMKAEQRFIQEYVPTATSAMLALAKAARAAAEAIAPPGGKSKDLAPVRKTGIAAVDTQVATERASPEFAEYQKNQERIKKQQEEAAKKWAGGGGSAAPAAPAKPSGGGGSAAPAAPAAPMPSGGGGGGAAPSMAAPATLKDSGSVQKTANNAQPPATAGGKGGALDDAAAKQMIAKHEGIRDKPYQDSLGLWTVGIGHLIGDGKTLPESWNRKFSKEEIMAMFDVDYEHHKAAAMKNIPNFEKMSGAMKAAFVDLTFNMGPAWINKWPNLKKQLDGMDIEGAISNLAGSKWATQVGKRAENIVGMLKSGMGAKDGGVFDGPKSGYPMTLHGPEAVIPLKDGMVPVSMNDNGVNASIQQLITQLSNNQNNNDNGNLNMEMLAAMQDIARGQRDLLSVSQRMLTVAAN
jgi:lysozyme